jgi:hypothetical protein
MQHFAFPASAVNAQPAIGLRLQVDLDASFRLFGVVVWNLGVPEVDGVDGQIAIRFARPDGRTIQRQMTASNQLFPGNQYNLTGVSPNKAWASPIRPSVLYPAGSVIEIDIQGLNTGIASPTGVIVVFVGTNVYQQGKVLAYQYPAKWTARPYLDNLTVNLGVPQLPKMNYPFTAQADSDFVWQAGAYTDFAVAGGGGSAIFSNEIGPALQISSVGGASGTFALPENLTPNLPFLITVGAGNAISVQLATNFIGDVTTTLAQLVSAINTNPLTDGIAHATMLTPGGSFGLPDNAGATPFGPGSATITLAQLADLGVIIRDPAYKAYSNTYVPVSLLFPFLSAQAPGWLYPEIYIPRLSQIYFDFNYLWPGFAPKSTPMTVTLALKGMKVYAQ